MPPFGIADSLGHPPDRAIRRQSSEGWVDSASGNLRHELASEEYAEVAHLNCFCAACSAACLAPRMS